MSHLFHRTHEQHYVAHVMAYSACIGPSAQNCKRPAHAAFTDDPERPEAAHPTVAPHAAKRPPSPAGVARPKFPTLSPILQELLDDKEQKVSEAAVLFHSFANVFPNRLTSNSRKAKSFKARETLCKVYLSFTFFHP